MSHTKEPWTYSRIEATPTGPIEPYSPWVDGAGPRLVTVDRSKCIHADDMRRIVACVNACANIRTDILEKGGGVFDILQNVAQQRDELLALVIRYRNETPPGHQPHMIAHVADELIAKVKP